MRTFISLLFWAISLGFVGSAFAAQFIEIDEFKSGSEILGKLANGERNNGGDVVVFTKKGKIVLPDIDKSLAVIDKTIKENQGKSAAYLNKLIENLLRLRLGNELSFTFESPESPWTDEERTTLQRLVTEAYPIIKKFYGNPAFSNTVNISKNPNLGSSGVYFTFSNEIILQSLTPDVLIHEMVHAFHDDLIFHASIYEEGSARAVEVAVLNELPQYSYWNRNHEYNQDVYYELTNQASIGVLNGNLWASIPAKTLQLYEQSGYAFGKMVIEDPMFFKRLNTAYYLQGYKDPSIAGSTERIRTIMQAVKPSVENTRFNKWYDQQMVFNFTPQLGYQTLWRGTGNVLVVFERDSDGVERALEGVTVTWEVYSCDGVNLLNGTSVTSPYGWIDIPLYELTEKGKIHIMASAYLADGTELKTEMTTIIGPPTTGSVPEIGLFGITDTCTGEITVTSSKGKVRHVPVMNGAFIVPELIAVPGTFKIKKPMGRQKSITKDKGDYYVDFD